MNKSINVRKLTATAMLAALASVLMYFPTFKLPIMPSFITLDFADMPCLVAAVTMGPVSGVAVALVKNIVNLFSTMTGGVGELSNFMLACFLCLPAGFLCNKHKKYSKAIIGSFIGVVCMALMCIVTNVFIVYPIYYNFFPEEVILGMYQAINPAVQTVTDGIIWFNVPFTFCKGLACALMAIALMKPLLPLVAKQHMD